MTPASVSGRLPRMKVPTDLIPLKDAQQILEVSDKTMTRLVRDKLLKVYTNTLDRRAKLVSRTEVEKLKASSVRAAA